MAGVSESEVVKGPGARTGAGGTAVWRTGIPRRERSRVMARGNSAERTGRDRRVGEKAGAGAAATPEGVGGPGVLEALPFGAMLVDEGQRILWSNRAAEGILGDVQSGTPEAHCPRASAGCDGAAPGCPLEQVLKEGRSAEVDVFREEDGRWLRMAVHPTGGLSKDGRQVFVHTILDITEQKRAEQDLRDSGRRFRDLANLLPLSVWEIDLEGSLTFVNRRALEWAGVPPGEVREEPGTVSALRVFVPEDRDRAWTNIQRILNGEDIGGIQYTQVRSDGSTYPVEVYAAPIIQEGRAVGLRGVSIDITERKQAQEELEQSERKYRQLVDLSASAVFSLDLEGNFLFVNRQWQRLTGYSADEVRGTSGFALVHPDDVASTAEEFLKVLRGESVENLEFRTRSKDGSYRNVLFNASPATDSRGNVVSAIGSALDITERRQAEEVYRTLTDSSPIGVYIVQDRKFVFVNPQFLEYTGYREEDLLGTDPLEIVHPEDRDSVRHDAVAMLKGTRDTPYEFRATGKNGRVDWAMETVRSITHRGRRAVLGSFMVVTERRQTERQLAQKTRELEMANQAKSRFLASMSHELRTPLNAVIGFSELLLDGVPGEINDEQRQCLEDILASGRHLLTLIGDVLDISKVEAGKMELRLQDMDLRDVIDEAVQTVRPMAEEKRHQMRVSVSGGLPQAHADPGKVKQVLLNLLSNAIKFTPAGGRITVEATRGDGECEVSVVDNGIGVREADRESIFEVFVQGETLPDGVKRGTGLGLALARQFVELMGGRVRVESEYGRGSRFSFTLPEAKAEKPLAGKTEEKPAATPETEGQPATPRPRRVLVIDDDPKARNILRAWLAREEYVVFEAENAEEGLREAAELLPAVIVLDILLPGKDGWQVLQDLKSTPETADIPVVITSMLAEEELGYSLGAADYFVKPVDKRRFLKRVAELDVDVTKTVLVVDDNPADAHLVASLLKTDGIGVICAYGGIDGARLAAQTEPDLVVLDLLMPDMSGFDVVSRLRGKERTRDIPIIIVTAKDLTDKEQEALRDNATAIIEKSTLTRRSFMSEVWRAVGVDDYGAKSS